MRNYSPIITLTRNSRGIYSLDTSIGCKSGLENNKGGCYNDCYAAKSAKLYGYDFSNTILRDFVNEKHRRQIVNKINRIKLDFVRIGTSGDPSENWEHTISILKKIDKCNKQIVIITKHWTNLTETQIEYLKTINICINTSVSAIDKTSLLENSMLQYEKLKPFVKSVLRIVSCDFNKLNSEGLKLSSLQETLFKNDAVIDTVLRVNKNNKLVKDGIINVTTSKFLGKKATISKYNKKTYFGKCESCKEMCGIKLNNVNFPFTDKLPLTKQLNIFTNV